VKLHPPRPTPAKRAALVLVVAFAFTLVVAAALPATAAPSRAQRPSKRLWSPPTRSSATATAPAAHPAKDVKVKANAKAEARTGGKVAVLAFDGDGSGPVRKQVIRALRARGFRVNAGLRPVDSAGQYREMAETLGLAAYLDGEIRTDGDLGSATIRVRSGRTGTHVLTATFTADRRKLGAEVGKDLWRRLGPVLAQASADASRPHKREHTPMRINAGTPLESASTD
jgi:hypothetical protein